MLPRLINIFFLLWKIIITQYFTNREPDYLQPMEQNPLKGSDVLIMCSLTQTPTSNPDAMIGDFCINTGTSS